MTLEQKNDSNRVKVGNELRDFSFLDFIAFF